MYTGNRCPGWVYRIMYWAMLLPSNSWSHPVEARRHLRHNEASKEKSLSTLMAAGRV